MNFLKISVISSFIACLIFTVVCLVMNWLGHDVSDTLIQWFFTVFGVEFAATAAIKITKHTIKKKEIEDRLDKIKENNLEVEKSDLNQSDDNDYTYEGDEYYG